MVGEDDSPLTGAPGEVFSQVERMRDIGLAVPQVSDVACRLNQQHGTNFVFHQLDDAYRALADSLSGDGSAS